MEETTGRPSCPHCGAALDQWAVPFGSTWNAPFLWVCMNDECPYYVEGWDWMMEQYSQRASYRYSLDPENGKASPLPVVSPDALKGDIRPQEGSGDA